MLYWQSNVQQVLPTENTGPVYDSVQTSTMHLWEGCTGGLASYLCRRVWSRGSVSTEDPSQWSGVSNSSAVLALPPFPAAWFAWVFVLFFCVMFSLFVHHDALPASFLKVPAYSLFYALKWTSISVSITDNSCMIAPFGLLLSQSGLRLCSSGSCSDLLKLSTAWLKSRSVLQLPPPSSGWRSPMPPQAPSPLPTAGFSFLTLHSHLLFIVQQRCRWLLENHATWNRLGQIRKSLCYHRNSVLSNRTSNNEFWWDKGVPILHVH